MFVAAGCGDNTDFEELTIDELHDRMQSGELSSESLTQWYLDRIETLDQNGPQLNSIIEINADALAIARALDDERGQSGPRGPLHGIPVVLKANIDTADEMATSAGSLALGDHKASEDAFIAERLRDAGAVILAKANLSEWANFRSRRSTSGWSSLGGQTLNPYDTTRSPCGSSSGSAVAVAANLATVSVGTETDGSIVCPAGTNGVVGIKPTMGLVSRNGIIPISHSQDTAGPMARSVRDAAILLGAIAGPDPDDSVTRDAGIHEDYTAGLNADALAGRRIGVLRSYYGAGSNPAVEEILQHSIEVMEAAGATVVDDLDVDYDEMFSAEWEVLYFEFRNDLNAYLESSGARIQNLDELIEYNIRHANETMPWFGQDRFETAAAKASLADPVYIEALNTSRRIATDTLDGLLDGQRLDAIIAPTNGPAWKIDLVNGDKFGLSTSSIAAVAGYPSITVPAGFVHGLPIGMTFTGRAWEEKRLIDIAYAFEQQTRVRRPPEL